MRSEFILALQQLADEKGIQVDAVLDSLRTAVSSAYYDLGAEYEDIDVEISPDTGEATIYANKVVVQEVTDPIREISLVDAQGYDAEVPLGEIFQIDVTPPNFGRIATQRARQTMQQALRDAERMEVYTQFIEHQGEILVGRVTRVESRGVFVELGRAEAVMLFAEQIPGEFYRVGQRMRVLLLEVSEGGRGAQLKVSRGHADFVRRLFEREVPEIQNGLVEIVGIARDAGVRSKVAVRSLQEGLDPVGACVGMRGTRIQNILRELGEEKAEIIEWAADLGAYVANALSPARVQTVHISAEERVADVFVHPDMVSLAIGREGQNSRLAARLTGFRINIRDASAPAEARGVAAPDEPTVAEPDSEDGVAEEDVSDATVVEGDAQDVTGETDVSATVPAAEISTAGDAAAQPEL
jgi:N utilization substance protein A